MTLVLVVDQADPTPPHMLPGEAVAVAGYVGLQGSTPHVWSLGEVNAVRASGRQWWPIVVPPQRTLTGADGGPAAECMIAACHALGVSTDTPVLIDIEHASWVANPAGAQACISEFKSLVGLAGFRKAYAYVPAGAGFDWIAHWTNIRPTELPDGCVGVQYGGGPGGAYDLSVFEASLMAGATPLPQPEDDDVTPQQLQDGLDQWFANGQGNPRTGRIVQAVNTSLAQFVPKVVAALSALPGNTLTEAQMETAIRNVLGSLADTPAS